MSKQNRKDFKTASKDLVVRINIRNNRSLLFGRGIDVKTGRPIPGCTAKLRLPFPLNTKQIPDYERMLVRKIKVKFEEMASSKQENHVHSETGIYTAAFATIEDKSIFHRGSWNDDTFNKTLSYLENQILPRLDELGLDIGREDILKLHDVLILRANGFISKYSIRMEKTNYEKN